MSSPQSTEGFQPRAHWAPDTPLRRFLFQLRQVADLQTKTIYRDLRRESKGFSGKLLDVGCGNSPFRHLFDPQKTQYHGIDVKTAESFGYNNPDTVYYDGQTIPFPDNYFDGILCTEVLEHVPEPLPFIAEMHRVMKPGGFAWVTIPWSARFHYQPHDYHRYTPSTLQQLFVNFSSCKIQPRGTDYSSIASKIVVAYIRNLTRIIPSSFHEGLLIPFRLIAALIGCPLLIIALILGHLGATCNFGSSDDPLGYTIVLRK